MRDVEIDLGIEGLKGFEVIGRGGSAIVYRARDERRSRTVAVKVLQPRWEPDVLRRFDRERQVMAKLSEISGFVPIHEAGQLQDGSPYIVMPYYRRGSLQDLLDVNGPMAWQDAVETIERAGRTIALAHGRQIYHRDLKPANILLAESGEPRVTDFGIARSTSEGSGPPGTTTTTAFTPSYSPPEVYASGTTDYAAVDVYGLAATFWALLAGHAPFYSSDEEPNPLVVIRRVATEPPGALPTTVPRSIRALITAAMAKDPRERPRSIDDFLSRLRNAAAEENGPIVPPTSVGSAATKRIAASMAVAALASPAGRRRVLLTAAVLVPLLAMTAAALVWQRSADGPSPGPGSLTAERAEETDTIAQIGGAEDAAGVASSGQPLTAVEGPAAGPAPAVIADPTGDGPQPLADATSTDPGPRPTSAPGSGASSTSEQSQGPANQGLTTTVRPPSTSGPSTTALPTSSTTASTSNLTTATTAAPTTSSSTTSTTAATPTTSTAPSAVVAAGDQATAGGRAVVIHVLNNDDFGSSEPDNSTLVVVAGPSSGTTTIVGRNIRYTPSTGYVGADSFTYRICSKAGRCDQASVLVTVTI